MQFLSKCLWKILIADKCDVYKFVDFVRVGPVGEYWNHRDAPFFPIFLRKLL